MIAFLDYHINYTGSDCIMTPSALDTYITTSHGTGSRVIVIRTFVYVTSNYVNGVIQRVTKPPKNWRWFHKYIKPVIEYFRLSHQVVETTIYKAFNQPSMKQNKATKRRYWKQGLLA